MSNFYYDFMKKYEGSKAEIWQGESQLQESNFVTQFTFTLYFLINLDLYFEPIILPYYI